MLETLANKLTNSFVRVDNLQYFVQAAAVLYSELLGRLESTQAVTT